MTLVLLPSSKSLESLCRGFLLWPPSSWGVATPDWFKSCWPGDLCGIWCPWFLCGATLIRLTDLSPDCISVTSRQVPPKMNICEKQTHFSRCKKLVLCRWERETYCGAMPVEEWNTKMFYQKVNVYSGPSAREAPWVRKIDDLKSRENLFMTSSYELASSWQTLGEGEGSLNRDLYRKLLKAVNFPIFRFPFPPSPTDRCLENIPKNKTSWIYIAYCDFSCFFQLQSNLDYPDLDYPDFSIIRTYSLVPFFFMNINKLWSQKLSQVKNV